MFDYNVYKLLHLVSIFAFIGLVSVSFYSENTTLKKVMTGVTGLLILVAGMGLTARIGISHKGPYPSWWFIKLACWLLIVILAPILIKRAKGIRSIALSLILFIIFFAAFTAIYKFGKISGF